MVKILSNLVQSGNNKYNITCVVQVSSKLDLGRGLAYDFQTELTNTEESGLAFSTRLTTPHAHWDNMEARFSHQGPAHDFQSSAYLATPLLDAVSASGSLRFAAPFDMTAAAALNSPLTRDWKMEVGSYRKIIDSLVILFVCNLTQT